MTPDDATEPPLDLRIVSPGVSVDELAAVTAVVHGALDELADDLAAAGGTTVSAWQRRQRNVRSPVTPGTGRWRNYSG